MSNYSNNVNLHVFVVDKNKIDKTTLIPVFDLDSDFMENEDYFREDTLELGYKSESERCAEEIFEACNNHKDPMTQLQAMMNAVPEYSNGEQTFLIGNSNYSGDYEIELTEVGNSIVISIAYIC